MKAEVSYILQKYSICDPDTRKPQLELGEGYELSKNPKYLFLKGKLEEFYKARFGKRPVDKNAAYFKQNEEWKGILYKNLHNLLREATLTQDPVQQDLLLAKVESWYFSKLVMPKEVKNSDLGTLPYKFNYGETLQAPRARHQKSYSLDAESRSRVITEYQIAQKEEILQLGSTETRRVIKDKYFANLGLASSSTPQPYKAVGKLKLRKGITLGPLECKGIGKRLESGQECQRKNLKTPFGYDRMGEGSQFILLSKAYPSGGELLLKAPVPCKPAPIPK